jgi:hypothetical protein
MCVSKDPDYIADILPFSRYYNTLIPRDLRGKTRGVPLCIVRFYMGYPPAYTRLKQGGVPYVFVFYHSLLSVPLRPFLL